jgi:hypothetical protein
MRIDVHAHYWTTTISICSWTWARPERTPIKGRRWDWTVRAEALAQGPSNPAARALWTMLPDQKPTLTGA